jgi:hypothetical protein
VSAEILELLTRIAELERKLDSMFRPGRCMSARKSRSGGLGEV